MKRTPLFALWTAPLSTLRCAGVPRPPDCSGSCLTSPKRAPALDPVPSTNGAWLMPVLSTMSLGSLESKTPGIMPTLLKPPTKSIAEARNIIPSMIAAMTTSW